MRYHMPREDIFAAVTYTKLRCAFISCTLISIVVEQLPTDQNGSGSYFGRELQSYSSP